MRRLTPTAQRRSAAARKTAGKPRRPTRRANRRLLAGAAAGLLALAGATELGWLWHSGWIDRQATRLVDGAYALSARAGLAVDDVLVEGRKRTKRSAILEALEVRRGVPLLDFDPAPAKARLERLPWVREAIVERRLPGVVFVRLVEREPLALWQLEGELSVIDDRGDVIPGAKARRFAQLPLVVGEDAPAHARELLRVLASEPHLEQQVTAAVRVGGRRWNVRLANGIDVQLPASDAGLAWAQLAKIERQQGVLDRDVVVIDLRLPDRLVVRMAPGARPREGQPMAGEDT